MTRAKKEGRIPTRWSGQDFLSETGAAYLAGEIRDYWQALGYAVQTRIAPLDKTARQPGFCVRSDLVNGLPTNFKREHAAAIANDLRDLAVLQREAAEQAGAL